MIRTNHTHQTQYQWHKWKWRPQWRLRRGSWSSNSPPNAGSFPRRCCYPFWNPSQQHCTNPSLSLSRKMYHRPSSNTVRRCVTGQSVYSQLIANPKTPKRDQRQWSHERRRLEYSTYTHISDPLFHLASKWKIVKNSLLSFFQRIKVFWGGRTAARHRLKTHAIPPEEH